MSSCDKISAYQSRVGCVRVRKSGLELRLHVLVVCPWANYSLFVPLFLCLQKDNLKNAYLQRLWIKII